MNKYNVTVPITGTIVIEVDAENDTDAAANAIAISNVFLEELDIYEPDNLMIDELHATADINESALNQTKLSMVKVTKID